MIIVIRHCVILELKNLSNDYNSYYNHLAFSSNNIDFFIKFFLKYTSLTESSEIKASSTAEITDFFADSTYYELKSLTINQEPPQNHIEIVRLSK